MDLDPYTDTLPRSLPLPIVPVEPGPRRHETRRDAALCLRASGATFIDIAATLEVDPATAARLVYEGMAALGVHTHAQLIAALRSTTVPAEVTMPEALSAAERDVVRLVLEGHSNAAVAAERRTSVRTVANQLQSIYAKLGVGSRYELVAWLLDAGTR